MLFVIVILYIYTIESASYVKPKNLKVMTTFKLNINKALNPATYKQVKYLQSITNCEVSSTSQLMKRLEKDEASDLIDRAQDGEEITITG